MNRWPTTPVAPNIPARSLAFIESIIFAQMILTQRTQRVRIGTLRFSSASLCEYLRVLCVKFLSFTLNISKLHPNDAHPHSTSLHPRKTKSASSLCSRYRMPKRESSLHRAPIQLRRHAVHHHSY